MPKKNRLPPLKDNEVRVLEGMANTCLDLLNKVESGQHIDLSPQFLSMLCRYNLHLYSRLIDANYVRRPLDPLVPFNTLH